MQPRKRPKIVSVPRERSQRRFCVMTDSDEAHHVVSTGLPVVSHLQEQPDDQQQRFSDAEVSDETENVDTPSLGSEQQLQRLEQEDERSRRLAELRAKRSTELSAEEKHEKMWVVLLLLCCCHAACLPQPGHCQPAARHCVCVQGQYRDGRIHIPNLRCLCICLYALQAPDQP